MAQNPLSVARPESDRLSSARHSPARLGMARFRSARLGLARLSTARSSAWLGSAGLGRRRPVNLRPRLPGGPKGWPGSGWLRLGLPASPDRPPRLSRAPRREVEPQNIDTHPQRNRMLGSSLFHRRLPTLRSETGGRRGHFARCHFTAEGRQSREAKPGILGSGETGFRYPGSGSERFDGQIEGRLC